MAGDVWDAPNQEVVRGGPPATPKEEFDPGEHTVDEVKAYVAENADQAAAITKAEEDGKGRVSLLEWLAGTDPDKEPT